MKIYKNTFTGPPLMDAIDDYARAYEARDKGEPSTLWQVRLHMAGLFEVGEKTILTKDCAYFCKRMGSAYLERKVRGIGPIQATRLCLWAESFQ